MVCTAHPALATAPATARAQILDPVEIDRAISAFTGAAIGEVGGARAPADRRLRLAACAMPLVIGWHGTTRAAVRVECPQTLNQSLDQTIGDAGSWRIFVATRSPAQTYAKAARMARDDGDAPLIKRGDPITVVVRGRGFTVQQSGEAMENGRVGDWIGVRTTRKGEPVRARIERPGLAVIPAS